MPSSTNTPSTPGGGNIANPFLQDLATHRQQATAVPSEANSQNATGDPIVVSAGLEDTSQSAPNSHKKNSKTSKSTAAQGASSSRKRDHDNMSNAPANTGDGAAHIAAHPSGGVFQQPTKYQRILPANPPPNLPTNLPSSLPANPPASLPPNTPVNPPVNGPGNTPPNIQLSQNHTSAPVANGLTSMQLVNDMTTQVANLNGLTSRNDLTRQAQTEGLSNLLSSQIEAHKSHIEACEQAFQDLAAAHRRADAAREWEMMTIHSLMSKRQEKMEEIEEQTRKRLDKED